MTKRIVFEGIWGSNLEKFTERFVATSDFHFDRVKVGIAPAPFGGLKNWVYALTQNMENWKESEGIVLHERSVWSSYYYASALVNSDELAQAEIDLFKNMAVSLSELNALPDIIVYFHSIPKIAQANLEASQSICAELGVDSLMKVSKSMIEGIEDMQSQGVKVLEIAPEFDNFENWFSYAENLILEALNGVMDGD
jgi:hypothetical protein